MLINIFSLIIFILLALGVGNLASKVKLPAILGWLVTGMVIGPYALGFMSESMINSQWFKIIINIAEVFVGILVGSTLVISELKKSGKQIAIICLFEGMGAFLLVTITFLLATGIPISIALIFGAIALATAPTPSLSIVKEYNAKGPVAKTLIPLAALDDVLAILVFFFVIGAVSGTMTGEGINTISILMTIITPFIIGAIPGIIGVRFLEKEASKKETILKVVILALITAGIGIYVNRNIISINLLLVGMSLSAIIANKVPKERLESILLDINPIIVLCLVIDIVNLGAPLDYKLIFGAGILTAIYIVARGVGKVGGTYLGGKISKSEENICKYLGFTLLPHSGVSLIFTGIAVSSIEPFTPEYATMIQGTIAAAAVINEFIAVFLAKQAFKIAREIEIVNKDVSNDKELNHGVNQS